MYGETNYKPSKTKKKVEKPQASYGVESVNEIKTTLNSVRASINSAKSARDNNRPVDLSKSLSEAEDKLDTLEALINTLL